MIDICIYNRCTRSCSIDFYCLSFSKIIAMSLILIFYANDLSHLQENCDILVRYRPCCSSIQLLDLCVLFTIIILKHWSSTLATSMIRQFSIVVWLLPLAVFFANRGICISTQRANTRIEKHFSRFQTNNCILSSQAVNLKMSNRSVDTWRRYFNCHVKLSDALCIIVHEH